MSALRLENGRKNLRQFIVISSGAVVIESRAWQARFSYRFVEARDRAEALDIATVAGIPLDGNIQIDEIRFITKDDRGFVIIPPQYIDGVEIPPSTIMPVPNGDGARR